MRDPNNPCLFCNINESGVAHENDLAYASFDSYPVSRDHCLIIPKRHIKDYDEILLLGSGKGVTSVKSINEIKWKRKSLKKFNFLSKQYDLVIKNCNSHRF